MITNGMVRGCATILCGIFLAYCLVGLAQSTGQDQRKEKPGTKGGTAGKEARWEGRVERIDKSGNSLTVRKAGSTLEKTCVYDNYTKWISQYHGDKKVNDIDASQVKEQDYVICKGTAEKAGEIHAAVISKRRSHSP
jgi:hypothetical protein